MTVRSHGSSCRLAERLILALAFAASSSPVYAESGLSGQDCVGSEACWILGYCHVELGVCRPLGIDSIDDLATVLQSWRDYATNRCRATEPRHDNNDASCIMSTACWSYGNCVSRSGQCAKPVDLGEHVRAFRALQAGAAEACKPNEVPRFFYEQKVEQLLERSEAIQRESDKLRQELELALTPEALMSRAKVAAAKRDWAAARTAIAQLLEKQPDPALARSALSLRSSIDDTERRAKAEAARQVSAIAAYEQLYVESVGLTHVTVGIGNFSFGDEWSFDCYGGGSCFYVKADMDQKYFSGTVTITTLRDKNPSLPPIALFVVKPDGTLKLVKSLEYRFSKWEDYGSYLGTEPDYGNDFAKSEEVGFTVGAAVPEELQNESWVVVLGHATCHRRTSQRFSQPPISYHSSACRIPRTLRVEDFTIRGARYSVIAVHRSPSARSSSCSGGKVVASGDGSCCWPGQTWVESLSTCSGVPDCPNGLQSVGGDCKPPEDAASYFRDILAQPNPIEHRRVPETKGPGAEAEAKADVPRPASEPVTETVARLVERGLEEYRRGNFEKAVQSFERAQALDPSNVLIASYLKMARAHRE